MRISDWSSDVCSSDLRLGAGGLAAERAIALRIRVGGLERLQPRALQQVRLCLQRIDVRLRAFLGDEHLRSPTRMEYSQARRSLNAPTAGTYPRVCACTAAPVIVIGLRLPGVVSDGDAPVLRSEEHTSEHQS